MLLIVTTEENASNEGECEWVKEGPSKNVLAHAIPITVKVDKLKVRARKSE